MQEEEGRRDKDHQLCSVNYGKPLEETVAQWPDPLEEGVIWGLSGNALGAVCLISCPGKNTGYVCLWTALLF